MFAMFNAPIGPKSPKLYLYRGGSISGRKSLLVGATCDHANYFM